VRLLGVLAVGLLSGISLVPGITWYTRIFLLYKSIIFVNLFSGLSLIMGLSEQLNTLFV
jgi:hypothetical protein